MLKNGVQTVAKLIPFTMSFNMLAFVPQDHADLRSHFFTVGMKLETVNMSEPFHICPASVTKVGFLLCSLQLPTVNPTGLQRWADAMCPCMEHSEELPINKPKGDKCASFPVLHLALFLKGGRGV